MSNQFGEKIRQLRESKHLLQRQVASQLDIDSPMLSKIERGERRAKKEYISLLADLYKINHNKLLTLWLADQLVNVLNGEAVALKAIEVAEQEVKHKKTRK